MLYDTTYDSYEDLLLHLRTEENARRYLAYIRWGGHPKCSHCGHQGPSTYDGKRKIFYCGNCAKQFSVTTGTIFERSHLPILKWFKAMFEIANGSISSVRLSRKLSVNQRTAWKVEQKIRQALKDDLDGLVLSNIVEADTSIFTPNLDRDFKRKWRVKKLQKIVSKDNDHHKHARLKKKQQEYRRRRKLGLPSPPTGRPKGIKNKSPYQKKGDKKKNEYYKYEKWVLAMVERGGKIYLQTIGQHSSELNSEKIASIMTQRIDKESRVITDGGGEFDKVSKYFPIREIIIHEPWVEFTKKDGTIGRRQVRKFVEGDKHTNTVESTWAHLKRVQWGNHIQISYGHADRYLYEFAFQRNNRELSDAEKFQVMLKSALKMAFPYAEFKSYTRVYRLNEEGKEIGKRVVLNRAA